MHQPAAGLTGGTSRRAVPQPTAPETPSTCPGNAPVQPSSAAGLAQGGERGHCKGTRSLSAGCTGGRGAAQGEGRPQASPGGAPVRAPLLSQWAQAAASGSLEGGTSPDRRDSSAGRLGVQPQTQAGSTAAAGVPGSACAQTCSPVLERGGGGGLTEPVAGTDSDL